MSEELVLSRKDQLLDDCARLRKSLSKSATNMILVPSVKERLARVLDAAESVAQSYTDVPQTK